MEIKRRHIIEYVIMLGMSVVFITLFVLFRSNRELLKLFSGLISTSYILWGIIHSALEKRMTWMIVLEYVLFGLLVFLILFFALSF